MANWEFKSLHGIGINGFNAHGASFREDPIYHLAKEICQNSTDTMIGRMMDPDKPIRVEFREFWIKPTEIPGNENGELTKVFEEELEFANKSYETDKTVPEIYKKTVNVIKSDNIRCIRISDFNTPGLAGSDKECDAFTPWNDLTANVGISDKSEETAGSKGEGKFVSFICSDLYTVFYSTYSKKDNLKASRGVTRLSGYKKADGSITLGPGFYDNHGRAVTSIMNLDPEFERKEYGTDVYIIGFRSNPDWEERIASSIIENFFVSILNNNLEVNINNKYVLNKNTINDLMNNEKIREEILNDDSIETLAYYDLLSSDKYIDEKYSMFEKDDIELFLKEDDIDYGDINKVAAVRYTGMKILNLKNFPRVGLYHGVLLMKGKEVNKYFKKLENATHSKWSEDAETAPADARKRINEVRQFIKDTINKHFKTDILDEMDATGVEETLPDEEEFENPGNDEKNENVTNEVINTVEIKKKKQVPSDKQTHSEKDINGDDGIELDDEGSIIIPGYDPDPEDSESNVPQPNSIQKAELNYSNLTKSLIPNKLRLIEGDSVYNMILKVKEDQEIIKLSFDIYGENGNEPTSVSECTCMSEGKEIPVEIYERDIIVKNIKRDVSYNFRFEIESDGIYPLEVKMYGNN